MRRNAAISQPVSQLFHGPAPRSPLHRLAVRLRHSRSNTIDGVTAYRYAAPRSSQRLATSKVTTKTHQKLPSTWTYVCLLIMLGLL